MTQQTGPRRKAYNEVIGGEPEDMNEMPPTFEPDEEGPVYDGHDLSRGEAIENVPREEGQSLEP